MVEDYKEKTGSFWDDILKGPPALSKEDADAMMEKLKKTREEYGFRKIR